jgi:hypothetical protein
VGLEGHVLILTPFNVSVRVQPITLIPDTGSSFGYFPRLPMLMPWPGPQVTFVIVTSLLPSPREIQSSPVAMFVSVMLIPDERPMWIPSVFALSPGAVMVTCWNMRFLHPKTLMWKFLLFSDLMSRTIEFVMKSSLIFCSFCKVKS